MERVDAEAANGNGDCCATWSSSEDDCDPDDIGDNLERYRTRIDGNWATLHMVYDLTDPEEFQLDSAPLADCCPSIPTAVHPQRTSSTSEFSRLMRQSTLTFVPQSTEPGDAATSPTLATGNSGSLSGAGVLRKAAVPAEHIPEKRTKTAPTHRSRPQHMTPATECTLLHNERKVLLKTRQPHQASSTTKKNQCPDPEALVNQA